jgi:RNA polymerase sigma-70 factor, ECF subfamily
VTENLLTRFEERVVPLMDDAYTLARYVLRDEHDAQDAVQEAYLRAWRFYASFRGGDERAWLLTIVRNCCYSWRQSRRDTQLVAYDDDAHGAEQRDRYAADAGAIGESDSRALTSAIDGLAQEFREVVVLRELDGCSYQEIARITGVPIGTVMSRLARARERLRRALKRTA